MSAKKLYFTAEERHLAKNRANVKWGRKHRAAAKDEFQAALLAYPRRTWYYTLPLEEPAE